MKNLIAKWNDLMQEAWDCGYDNLEQYGHESERKKFRAAALRYLKNAEGDDRNDLIRIIENTVGKWR